MITRHIFIATLMAASVSTFAAANAQQQTPANPPARPQIPTTMLGTTSHEFYIAKIAVSDLPKSYEFYTKVIGLKQTVSPGMEPPKPPTAADPEKDFVELAMNVSGSLADPIFVLTKRRGTTPSPEFTKTITVGFKVPNARETVARAVQAGYKSIRDPSDGPMAVGLVADPDGYTVELVQAPSYPIPTK